MGRGKEKLLLFKKEKGRGVLESGLGRCLLGLPSHSFALGTRGQGCSLDRHPISLAFPGTPSSHVVWRCDGSQEGSHRRGTGR